MSRSPKPRETLLFTWIGSADLKGPESADDNCGPIARILAERNFDRVLMLSDWGEKNEKVTGYLGWLDGWLARNGRALPKTHLIDWLPRCAPKTPGEIYELAASVLNEHRADSTIAFNVSSGVPKMQTVCYLLAATKALNAELIEASVEQKVLSLPPLTFVTQRYTADVTDAWLHRARAALEEPKGQPASQARLNELVQAAAANNQPVLILGELGTGKRTLAWRIHKECRRANDPKELHCMGISDFKTATQKTKTTNIILLEIDTLPLGQQLELMRAVAEERIGRVLATTSRDLWEEVRLGRFRADLLYLLSINVIELPPLRKRQAEFLGICEDILRQLAGQEEPKALSEDALELLRRQDWPGNLRELQSVLLRAAVRSRNNQISAGDIAPCLFGHTVSDDIMARPLGDGFAMEALIDEVKRHYLTRALTAAGGNQTRAANLLGLSKQNFGQWIKKLQINFQDENPLSTQ